MATLLANPSHERRALSLPRADLLILGGLGLAKLAINAATSGSYGLHRDELYYLASGRHPALGYVDFPPVTPMLARLSLDLFGPSVFWLRMFPALAGAIIVVLAGLIAAELGGSRFARVLAAGAVLTSTVFLGANWLFQTVTFDQLAWAVALLLAARMVRTGEVRLWLAIGVALGVGLETKYTILALCLGLAVALLACRRRDLLTPWPWLGAAIALLLLAPNLWWQATHGWLSLRFILYHPVAQSADFSPLVVLAGQIVLVGPLAVPLWLAGWVRLLHGREVRFLGVTALVAFLVFTLTGKDYYAAPLYPLLFAAGAVTAESVARRAGWLRAVAAVALALDAIVLAPFAIPLVPPARLHQYGLDVANKDFAATVGWPEVAAQVAAVYDSLPPAERAHAVILAGNFGEAGAIDLYGPSLGLPPAICPEMTYWLWKPAHVDDGTVIVVGATPADVTWAFGDVRVAAPIRIPYGVQNQSEVGRDILVARQPHVSLDAAWPHLLNLN
jgi:4-amino-4-deoxy-L-arabinose transferase-like glycosyltransferase